MGSISVASSLSAPELFTRFDTGQRCNMSLLAGLSGAAPPSISHESKIRTLEEASMRSCISAATALGSVTADVTR
jgi:hypothetical protein